jgi:hypothetical protein
MCIQAQTGITPVCAACLTQDLQCAVNHCLMLCSSAPNSQGCVACRENNCLASFTACSGLTTPTGVFGCSDILGGGPTVTPWQPGIPAADFTTDAAFGAYSKYDSCACSASCGSTCSSNYCSGQSATMACAFCIQQSCGGETMFCAGN